MWLFLCIAGIFFWTFMEYVLHRFLGHVHKGKNFFKAEHKMHHAKADYFAPVYKKVVAAMLVSIALFLLLDVFLSALNAVSFIVGFMGMYFLYERTHYRYHQTEPIAKPFIVLRKHHFYHHFHDPSMNHGVTTRFWDRVFGTYTEVEVVVVPKRMSMSWLVSDDEVKQSYSKHFRLNSR
ncbi:MAG: sterol desaturase family protein [Chitinophagales bacterium]|nr:sterol desaturase family protein [Chitinophagales bacterium]